MSHDRNARIDEFGDSGGEARAAFDFNPLGAGFLKKTPTVTQYFGKRIVGEGKGKVADYNWIGLRTYDGRRVVEHHVEGHADRVGHTQDRIAHGIAYEDEVGTPFAGKAGGNGIIGREADNGPHPFEGTNGPVGGLHGAKLWVAESLVKRGERGQVGRHVALAQRSLPQSRLSAERL